MLVSSQGGKVANINFFMSLAIMNTQTNQILKRAFNQVKKDLSLDALYTFDIKSEEGKAILGMCR